MIIDKQTHIAYMTTSEAYLVADLFSPDEDNSRTIQDKAWACLLDWALTVADPDFVRQQVGQPDGGAAILGDALAGCTIHDTSLEIAIPATEHELSMMKAVAAKAVEESLKIAGRLTDDDTNFHVGYAALGNTIITTIDDYLNFTQR